MCLSCSLEQLSCCPHLNNSPSLLPFCCFSPQAFACTVRNSGINGEARSWRPLALAVRFGPSKLGTTNRDSAEISRTIRGLCHHKPCQWCCSLDASRERSHTHTHTHTVTPCLLIRSSNGQEKVSANGTAGELLCVHSVVVQKHLRRKGPSLHLACLLLEV